MFACCFSACGHDGPAEPMGDMILRLGKRILWSITGLVTGLTAFFLFLVAGLLFFQKFDDDQKSLGFVADAYMTVFMFVLGEIFLLFGIVCAMVSLCCFTGTTHKLKSWIGKLWKKVVRYALLLPLVALVFVGIHYLYTNIAGID